MTCKSLMCTEKATHITSYVWRGFSSRNISYCKKHMLRIIESFEDTNRSDSYMLRYMAICPFDDI